MPRIFDNIDRPLLPALQQTLEVAYRADFCVGYFNLRGWRQIDAGVEQWAGGPNAQCRLLVGMQRRPKEELQAAYRFGPTDDLIDSQTAARLKRELAEEFRQQLTVGAPTAGDEAGLRRLAGQIRAGKVQIKLFLRHPLHAKLYLLHRSDQITPIVGYLGSSNLTFSGLSGQGELNIDVVEQDAAAKLVRWFEDRWEDRWCLDISQEIVQAIEESWAGEELLPPYLIYLKMAYHLSREARAGLAEFTIPREFGNTLFDFQAAAVKIAARHLNQRGGVLIGDVVGLGKTLMATALAKIFEEDFGVETLIICPKNLVKMWEFYRDEYGLRARVLSLSRVLQELADLRRYRLVLIDESHNLRNREGKRYRVIQEYIQRNESRCILLSATPYNKSYLDLASQLRLFVPETSDLGIRPENLLRDMGEVEFARRYQAPLRSLEAFEKSEFADDWRELMRLFMVRRTRTFIRNNYAQIDADTGRQYLRFADGGRAYFPERVPRTVPFRIDEGNANDQYARLYTDEIVSTIGGLSLPRYGLGNYVLSRPPKPPTPAERRILEDLTRSGRRLMGFSRTNLFKRLESNGYAFLLSLERHILRNFVFVHALENGLDLPIGTQGAEMLDSRFEDEDADAFDYSATDLFDDGDEDVERSDSAEADQIVLRSEATFLQRAAAIYRLYARQYRSRFRWIRSNLFRPELAVELRRDALALLRIVEDFGAWDVQSDAKLEALYDLLTRRYPQEKVLVFSQFADTVNYLATELQARGVQKLAGVSGLSADPTELAWRFSPASNNRTEQVRPDDELRVLLATDVLSEGQNLQDAAIVVNFDLPWAIIRLIQRAGRVDRIGQRSDRILCHTFLPADGVERIIRLRARLRSRLRQNEEVVGTDEQFFEDDASPEPLDDLYNERAGILDEEPDADIDLVSYAYQIWKNATDANPSLKGRVERLPNVVYSTKAAMPQEGLTQDGVLVYVNTNTGNSALAWIDAEGRSVTQSQFAVLRAAECALTTSVLPRRADHYDLVRSGVEQIMSETATAGGQLGRPSGARFKTYERMGAYAGRLRNTLLESLPATQTLFRAIEQIYRYPLRESAREKLNRQLRSNVQDEQLAELVVSLYEEDKLCLVQDEMPVEEPQVICSLGLALDSP